jgi:hypothetical protein
MVLAATGNACVIPMVGTLSGSSLTTALNCVKSTFTAYYVHDRAVAKRGIPFGKVKMAVNGDDLVVFLPSDLVPVGHHARVVHEMVRDLPVSYSSEVEYTKSHDPVIVFCSRYVVAPKYNPDGVASFALVVANKHFVSSNYVSRVHYRAYAIQIAGLMAKIRPRVYAGHPAAVNFAQNLDSLTVMAIRAGFCDNPVIQLFDAVADETPMSGIEFRHESTQFAKTRRFLAPRFSTVSPSFSTSDGVRPVFEDSDDEDTEDHEVDTSVFSLSSKALLALWALFWFLAYVNADLVAAAHGCKLGASSVASLTVKRNCVRDVAIATPTVRNKMAYLASETFGTMAQYAFVTMLPSVDACEVDGESTRLYTLEMDDQGEISVTKDTFEHEFFQFDMPTNPAALVGDVRNERRRRNRRSNGNTQSQMAQVPVQLAAATRTRQPGSLIPRVMVAPPVAKANSQHAAQQHLERYARAIVDPEHANAKVPNGGTGRSAAFKNSARVGLVTGSNGYGFCSLLPTAANDVPCIGATTATSTDTSFPNAVNGFTAATSSMFSQAPFAAAQFGINTLSPPTYEQAQSRPVSGIIKVTNETPYNNRGGEAYFINGYDSSINGLSYSDIERLRAEGMVTDIPTDGSTGEFHYRPTSNRDWDFGSTLLKL